MKKLYLVAITVMLFAPTLSRELSVGPGPMPVCPPDQPTCVIQGDNPLQPF